MDTFTGAATGANRTPVNPRFKQSTTTPSPLITQPTHTSPLPNPSTHTPPPPTPSTHTPPPPPHPTQQTNPSSNTTYPPPTQPTHTNRSNFTPNFTQQPPPNFTQQPPNPPIHPPPTQQHNQPHPPPPTTTTTHISPNPSPPTLTHTSNPSPPPPTTTTTPTIHTPTHTTDETQTPDPNIPPNYTIYINNLNDTIKIDELKKNLKSMFKQFGEIRDIIAMKSLWRRGQAWIVFKTINSATKALHGMQGFSYHGKNMRINYSITKSDIITREEGTFKPRPKGPKRPRGIIELERKRQAIIMHYESLQTTRNIGGNSTHTSTGTISHENKLGDKQAALLATVQARTAETVRDARKRSDHDLSSPMPRYGMPPMPREPNKLPNKVLFIENLPENVFDDQVISLFKSHMGYMSGRVISARRVAFIDFDNEHQAAIAMSALQGHPISGVPMKIDFAKR